MELYNSSSDYLFNLQATSSSDAKRMWRQSIKEKWKHKCAYCESTEYLTIDHIVPQSKGGSDFITNVLCCCRRCNNSKSHINWEEWYAEQDFFTEERYDVIMKWIKPQTNSNLYKYKPRMNTST